MLRREFNVLLGGILASLCSTPLRAATRSFVYEVVPAHARLFMESTGKAGRYTFSTPATPALETATGFSAIKQIAEIVQAPGKQAEWVRHHNLELVTYVLAGYLELSDSMGNTTLIRAGEVQVLHTGDGLTYKHINPLSVEPAYYVQIALATVGGVPSCQQTFYSDELRRGRLLALLSPDGDEDAMAAHQDYRVFSGLFSGTESANFTLLPGNHAYIQLLRGKLSINGVSLSEGEGLKVIKSIYPLTFEQGANAEVILVVVKES